MGIPVVTNFRENWPGRRKTEAESMMFETCGLWSLAKMKHFLR